MNIAGVNRGNSLPLALNDSAQCIHTQKTLHSGYKALVEE